MPELDKAARELAKNSDGRGVAALSSWPVLSGAAFGVVFMYATAMLVKI